MAIDPRFMDVLNCQKCGEPLGYEGEWLVCPGGCWRALPNPHVDVFHRLAAGEEFVLPGAPDQVLIKVDPPELPFPDNLMRLIKNEHYNAVTRDGEEEIRYCVGDLAHVIRPRDRRLGGTFSIS